MEQNFWIAIGLTAFAGASTGIGSIIAFFAKRTDYRFLSWGTGFAGGVMLYVSFMEIMPKAMEEIAAVQDGGRAALLATLAFFGGIAVIFAIDQLIPHAENPHEARTSSELEDVAGHDHEGQQAAAETADKELERTGMFTALAVAIHNFPEGLITFLTALADPALGVIIAIAIALHNIPEGISISVPIFYATGDRRRAFWYSAASGLAEPLGALVGYLILRPFLTPEVMGVAFGAVAGIMVFIALDELLPTSRAYGEGHDALYGLVAGMALMALSLLLLG